MVFCSHRIPTVGGKALDLYRLFLEVTSRGGLEKVGFLNLQMLVDRIHKKFEPEVEAYLVKR